MFIFSRKRQNYYESVHMIDRHHLCNVSRLSGMCTPSDRHIQYYDIDQLTKYVMLCHALVRIPLAMFAGMILIILPCESLCNHTTGLFAMFTLMILFRDVIPCAPIVSRPISVLHIHCHIYQLTCLKFYPFLKRTLLVVFALVILCQCALS